MEAGILFLFDRLLGSSCHTFGEESWTGPGDLPSHRSYCRYSGSHTKKSTGVGLRRIRGHLKGMEASKHACFKEPMRHVICFFCLHHLTNKRTLNKSRWQWSGVKHIYIAMNPRSCLWATSEDWWCHPYVESPGKRERAQQLRACTVLAVDLHVVAFQLYFSK